MRNLYNIDKSAFVRGVYIGYATYQGTPVVYRIRREQSGHGWQAFAEDAPTLRQCTLKAMSDSLRNLR